MLAEPPEREDEQDGGGDVGDVDESVCHEHGSFYLRNISSMRCVTAKPPAMLMAVMRTATPASHLIQRDVRGHLEQRADDDDAADGVGDAHQRRVQRWRDIPDHHVADETGEHEYREMRHERRRRNQPQSEQRRAAQ